MLKILNAIILTLHNHNKTEEDVLYVTDGDKHGTWESFRHNVAMHDDSKQFPCEDKLVIWGRNFIILNASNEWLYRDIPPYDTQGYKFCPYIDETCFCQKGWYPPR